MKSVRQSSFVAIVLVALAVAACAEPVAQLRPTGYVNDFAGVLSQGTVAQLNDICRQLETKAQAQVAVVTIKSLDGADIFDYSVKLYQQWGIGQKGKDRGVLILLAVNDHKYYVNTGYGLEAILPDGKVGRLRPRSRASAEAGRLRRRRDAADVAHRRCYCARRGRAD